MNEWLKKLFTSAKQLWGKWSPIQKVVLCGIIVIAVAALVMVFTLSSRPTTVPLFNVAITDEAVRDQIVYRLAEENVNADVSAAGIISVKDEATARRMRAVLVRDDLVPGSVDPWALFDVERWTTTDFERNVNLRRAITQVVTEHIEALDDIDKANVVITMPDNSNALVTSEVVPVTASVIIYPKPGSDITTNRRKIEGIQKLLLKAVSGLTDENITISDSSGTILNDFSGMEVQDRIDAVEREQKVIRQLESQYRAAVLNQLQTIFGNDRVRDLNIKIDMDMSKKQVNSTEYSPIEIRADNPDTPYDDSEYRDYLPISSETVTKRWTGTGYNPEGPAGVEGQNPPVYSDMSNLYGTSEESGVKQNNVINTSQISEEKSPSIDRVTVSVNIDGTWQRRYDENGNLIIAPNGSIEREYIPVSEEDLEQARLLVQGAIGYNSARGDSVSVQNIQYDRTAQFASEDMAYLRSQQTRRTIMLALAGIAAVLVAFMIFRFISRELERRRRIREEEMLRKSQMEREKTLWDAQEASMGVEMSVEERKRAEMQESILSMAKDHPEDVAMLIRTWLMEE